MGSNEEQGSSLAACVKEGMERVELLSVTLFLRVRVLRYGCRLPTQKTVADEER